MRSQFEDLANRLRGGLFLSSMMGITDGAFCAQRSAGCAMVQLGAYLAEPTATAEEMGRDAASYLPGDPAACTRFLADECAAARQSPDMVVALNLATPRLAWGLEAAACFARAGGDLVELNAHGSYSRYLELGKLRAMVRPEHRDELLRWVDALNQIEIPLVVKFNGQSDRAHLWSALEEMAARAVPSVHLNVRARETRSPDLSLVQEARARYAGLLLVSGYVRSAPDARACLEAGADAVGIADPTQGQAGYIDRIAQALRAG